MKAKYLEIKDYVHSIVMTGNHGDSLPSENELRKKFNASRVTVRHALEIIEQSGYLFRIKGKGAFINRRKKREKYYNCLAISHGEPNNDTATGRCLREIIAGVIAEASKRGCFLNVMCINEHTRTLTEECRRLNIDGVIAMLPYQNQYDILEELRQNGIPSIVINRILKNSSLNYICPDPEQVIELAVDKLVANGRKRIAYLPVWSFNLSDYYLKGYYNALNHAAITPQPELLLSINDYQGCTTEAKTLNALRKMLTSATPPDALIITGGIYYYQLFELLDELNIKTPGELEIVIMCDSQTGIPEGVPRKHDVHEMAQPFIRLGSKAMEELLSIMQGNSGRKCIKIPFEPTFKDFQ